MNPLLLPEVDVPPTAYDTDTWPTAAEIAAADQERAARADRDTLEEELRTVLAAVEAAAVPVTGPLPVSIPLTKADAHHGATEAVIVHACDRLREIARSRRTSELADVVTLLEAVLSP